MFFRRALCSFLWIPFTLVLVLRLVCALFWRIWLFSLCLRGSALLVWGFVWGAPLYCFGTRLDLCFGRTTGSPVFDQFQVADLASCLQISWRQGSGEWAAAPLNSSCGVYWTAARYRRMDVGKINGWRGFVVREGMWKDFVRGVGYVMCLFRIALNLFFLSKFHSLVSF